jgi:hypothetical protein
VVLDKKHADLFIFKEHDDDHEISEEAKEADKEEYNGCDGIALGRHDLLKRLGMQVAAAAAAVATRVVHHR